MGKIYTYTHIWSTLSTYGYTGYHSNVSQVFRHVPVWKQRAKNKNKLPIHSVLTLNNKKASKNLACQYDRISKNNIKSTQIFSWSSVPELCPVSVTLQERSQNLKKNPQLHQTHITKTHFLLYKLETITMLKL